MNGEIELIYHEEQKFGSWLRWPLLASMVFAAGVGIWALEKMPSEELNTPVILVVIIFGIIVPIGFGGLFWMLTLQTEVRGDGVYIRFLPIHFRFKRFGAEEIKEYYARQYKPIAEYGGWGIRYGKKSGRAYNVRGNKGVQLVFKNGKRLLIGSQRAEELEEEIGLMIGGG